jgi:hypothetical protein
MSRSRSRTEFQIADFKLRDFSDKGTKGHKDDEGAGVRIKPGDKKG